MNNQNVNVSMLITYFLNLREGNDVYALRYHTLKVLYQLTKKKLIIKFNTEDLYNLQYNYEHYIKGGNSNNVIMTDFEGKEITASELEVRLQHILSEMFTLLGHILEDYNFTGNFGFTQ